MHVHINGPGVVYREDLLQAAAELLTEGTTAMLTHFINEEAPHGAA